MSPSQSQQPVQLVTPMSPSRSGIAQYSADLLNAIDGRWPITLIREGHVTTKRRFWPATHAARQGATSDPTVIQLGNSENHEIGLELARRGGQVIVLHDVVLHHAMLSIAVNRRKTRQYRQMMLDTYGPAGDEIATSILTGRGEAMMMDYPLSESLIRDARLTVVHNHVAESMVRELVPRAPVIRIPMGVPLPSLTPQSDARRVLGIPESDFIVASITHVNPMKRLDKVIRAFASVVKSQPNARFIIAGSAGAGVDLPRLIRLHNLEQYIDIWGYIDDSVARLLARAADVCVNLRHPTAGETSASLLRLLGAARPVLVTDNVPVEDLPPGVGIRIPVDRLEVEMIADVLAALASDASFRDIAGTSARQFVESRHTMRHMVDGYHSVIKAAFDLDLPLITDIPNLNEASPRLQTTRSKIHELPLQHSALDVRVSESMSTIGLTDSMDLDRVAWAMTSIGLDQTYRPNHQQVDRVPRQLAKLRCPRCGAPLASDYGSLVCSTCHAELGTVNAPDLRPLA